MPLFLLGGLVGAGSIFAFTNTTNKLITLAVVGAGVYYMYEKGVSK